MQNPLDKKVMAYQVAIVAAIIAGQGDHVLSAPPDRRRKMVRDAFDLAELIMDEAEERGLIGKEVVSERESLPE